MKTNDFGLGSSTTTHPYSNHHTNIPPTPHGVLYSNIYQLSNIYRIVFLLDFSYQIMLFFWNSKPRSYYPAQDCLKLVQYDIRYSYYVVTGEASFHFIFHFYQPEFSVMLLSSPSTAEVWVALLKKILRFCISRNFSEQLQIHFRI